MRVLRINSPERRHAAFGAFLHFILEGVDIAATARHEIAADFDFADLHDNVSSDAALHGAAAIL
jgi:hypothetical protein